ncbi:MAG: hypothetical protein GKR86_03220 [Ilumatobacter sp.]|nr:hypothetical protein [Ilumatobacter sp.]
MRLYQRHLAGIQHRNLRLDVSATDHALTVRREPRTKATEMDVANHRCMTDLAVHSLGTIFDREPGGINGTNYPRTLQLADGKVLLIFQLPLPGRRRPDGRPRQCMRPELLGNWMLLAHAAMKAHVTPVHIATWPGSPSISDDISRIAAKKGRAFIISAGQF